MAMIINIYIKLIKWANKQIFIERKDILYLFIQYYIKADFMG